jgi:hypothetical protein
MERQRYVTQFFLRRYKGTRGDSLLESVPLQFTSKGVPIFDPATVRAFELAIYDSVLGKDIASLVIGKLDPARTTFNSSGEDIEGAVRFFRTFRQSPFRLLLFSSLTLMEKIGDRRFVCDPGENDKGRSHKSQLRQRIFFETKPVSTRGIIHSHLLGFFPRLSFAELNKILAANKPVPHRLLSPESSLRKQRKRSYASITWKGTRKGYLDFRRAMKVRN